MERAIGEIKHKVKSRSATGVNAGNIAFSLACQRYNARIKGDAPVSKGEILTDSNQSNAREIWGPLWLDTIDNYDDFNLGQLLKNYWTVHLTKDVKKINKQIEARSRLWIGEQEIIGSSFRERNERRRDDFFAKLTIDVDMKKKSKRIENEPRIYFGDVIFFFRHKQQGQTRLLALTNIYETTVPGPKGHPYIQQKAKSKHVVISAGDIECISGKVDAVSGRRYIIWPNMTIIKQGQVGRYTDINLIFIFLSVKSINSD